MAVFNQALTVKQCALLFFMWAADDLKEESGIVSFFGASASADLLVLELEGYLLNDPEGGWVITVAGQTAADDLFAQVEGDSISASIEDALLCAAPAVNRPLLYDQLLIDINAVLDTAPIVDPCVQQVDVDCMKQKAEWCINQLARGHKAMIQASSLGLRNNGFNRVRNQLLDARGIDVHFSCMPGSVRNSTIRDPIRALIDLARDSIVLDNTHITGIC